MFCIFISKTVRGHIFANPVMIRSVFIAMCISPTANATGATTDGAQRRRGASGLSERSDGTSLPHEPLSKTFTGFSDLHFSISRRRSCFQGAKKIAGDCCDLLNRSKECSLVCFRWLVEAANLSHELQGSRANFFFRHRRREVKKDLDISTHVGCSQCFGGHLTMEGLRLFR